MKSVILMLGLVFGPVAFAGKIAAPGQPAEQLREQKVEEQIQQLSEKDKEAIAHSVEESDVKDDDHDPSDRD